MRKWLFALGGVTVVLVLAWLLVPRFTSPSEAEELRSIPEPDPVTAPVEDRVLREVVQLEGTVTALSELDILANRPAGADRAVITYLPPSGEMIRSGEVIVGISNRPIIFLGDRPNLYRDLYRGLSGSDVQSFQNFLAAHGAGSQEALDPGVFDEEMELVVERFYTSLGYEPAPAPTMVTNDQVLGARNAVDQASQALAAARQGGDQVSINIATRNVTMARAQLDALQNAPRLMVPAVETLGLAHEVVVVVGSAFDVGQTVASGMPLITVRTAGVTLRSVVSRARGIDLTPGQPATVFTTAGQVETTVASVLPSAQSTTELEVVVHWSRAGSVPGERMIIEVETTSSDGNVMSVPVSAIRSDPDSTTYVTVIDQRGPRRVNVSAGVTIGGRTVVTGNLAVGDNVVVGRR